MAKINHEEYEILKGLDDRFEWIVKDSGGHHGGSLFAHSKKPFKLYDMKWWDCDGEIFSIDDNLFQFIQWEDGEPHNIAELIGEYESEETEVKKDIEFSEEFQESIMRAFDVEATSKTIEALTGMTLEQIAEEARNGVIMQRRKLPAIPKFVADYLDFAKSDVPLMRVMELANTRNEWPKWEKEYDWISANDETFARAWLDGFTVANEDEEQKYYVVLEENSYGAMGLGIDSEGRLTFTATYDGRSLPKLTEQEIKDYDERFWPFAVKVEEWE